jgi:Predicted integral membrane protein (DUF2269)
MPWFPALLAVHVALAVSLLLPSLLLPFLLAQATEGADASRRQGRVARSLLAMQGGGSVIIGVGLALTGAGLLAVLGPDLLRRPWLLAALAIYAANLAVAALISRPNLRRLVGRHAEADSGRWHRQARLQRRIAYLMAAATGVIGFLMSAKPEF